MASASTPARTGRSRRALRELGQTRAGWLVGSQFVFSQHCKSCRALGYSEEKIEALKAWQVSDLFSPLERALLAYTDALVLGFGRVDDAVFDAMKEHLDDEAILEFTYITMMYTMHAVISRALRLEYDNRDDPIVEIAAPGGLQGREPRPPDRRSPSTRTTERSLAGGVLGAALGRGDHDSRGGRAEAELRDRPTEAGAPARERAVEREPAGTCRGEGEPDGDQGRVVLVAALGDPRPVLAVDLRDREPSSSRSAPRSLPV